jgi:hypothetical protein
MGYVFGLDGFLGRGALAVESSDCYRAMGSWGAVRGRESNRESDGGCGMLKDAQIQVKRQEDVGT